MVKGGHYDIIFLDIRLPDMNGVDTFEHVKTIDPRAVVIMMTGYTEEQLIKRAIGSGAYTCIHKPFDMEKVIALVEKIAEEKKT